MKTINNKPTYVAINSIIIFIFIFTIALIPSSIFAEDKVKMCPDCHKKISKKLKGKYNHEPFEKNNCYGCHQFHEFRNKIELKGHSKDFCTDCHDIMLELDDETTHYPILDDDGCVTCHDPHSSDNELFLKDDASSLCFECHDEPDLNDNKIHKPYADKDCMKCHNPHGSLFPAMLHLPTGYICIDCHVNFIEYQPNEMHSGTDLNSCEQCHTGHTSDYGKILKDEPTKLCLSCHKDLKEKMESKNKHSILEDENCMVCHVPHYKKGESHTVDPEPDLCFGCHSDIEEKLEMEFVHAPVPDEACSQCHDPHAGVLIDNEVDLCESCHDIEDEDFLILHKTKSPLPYCTDCHDAHGTANEKLVKDFQHSPFEERDCESCHEEGISLKELRDQELCLNCHDEPENADNHTVENILNKVCVDCHSPHASSSSGLLRSQTLLKK